MAPDPSTVLVAVARSLRANPRRARGPTRQPKTIKPPASSRYLRGDAILYSTAYKTLAESGQVNMHPVFNEYWQEWLDSADKGSPGMSLHFYAVNKGRSAMPRPNPSPRHVDRALCTSGNFTNVCGGSLKAPVLAQ